MASDSATVTRSEKFCVHMCSVYAMRHVGTVVAVSGGVPHSCTVCIYTGC